MRRRRRRRVKKGLLYVYHPSPVFLCSLRQCHPPPSAPPPPCKTDLTPLNCVAMKPYHGVHISISLLGGNIVSSHYSSSLGCRAHSTLLLSDRVLRLSAPPPVTPHHTTNGIHTEEASQLMSCSHNGPRCNHSQKNPKNPLTSAGTGIPWLCP